ncbi:hypothetical protein PR048_004763, partial [Dryococelus australis]
MQAREITYRFETESGLPQVLGPTDGTHIPIIPPSYGYRDFINRNNWPSTVLQAVVDHRYLFRDKSCGVPGADHDATVLKHPLLFKKAAKVLTKASRDINGCEISPFLKGDPVYPLLPWLITGHRDHTAPEKESFNVYHNRAIQWLGCVEESEVELPQPNPQYGEAHKDAYAVLTSREHYSGTSLLADLRFHHVGGLYKNFTRMHPTDFEFLLSLIGHKISKQDTTFRKAIPAQERLVLTLRFLATGDSFASLQYLFKVSKQSISRIVSEVCKAIVEALKNYIQVLIPQPIYHGHQNLGEGMTDHQHLGIVRYGNRWECVVINKILQSILVNTIKGGNCYQYNYSHNVSIKIKNLFCTWLQIPQTQEERMEVAEGFDAKWNFPHCIGSLDGKHIALQCPRLSGSEFYNFKGFFSIVLFAVVDANYNFTSERVKTKKFNYRVCRARQVVENVFRDSLFCLSSVKKTNAIGTGKGIIRRTFDSEEAGDVTNGFWRAVDNKTSYIRLLRRI